MTASETYFWITILICIGVFQLSVADFIISLKHRAIMNFRMAPETLISKYMNPFRLVYDGIGAWLFKILILLCSITSIGMVIIDKNPKFLLIAILLIHILSYPRWRYFVSSDSPLFRAIIMALILHYFFPFNQVISEASLLFIAIYLVLIYQLTAIQKIKSHLWRNGQAIQNFVNRYSFWRMVNPSLQKPKWLLIATTWGVILFELCFFTGLFLPRLGLFFVISGLIFHGVLSFSVGINHFFWTFIAGYPAYLYLSGKLPDTLSHLSDLFESF